MIFTSAQGGAKNKKPAKILRALGSFFATTIGGRPSGE
jgi:hypothetical protein